MDIFKLGDKILALLEAVFGFWNNQISLVFAMLGQSPVSFKGGGPWAVIEGIEPVFVAVGSSLAQKEVCKIPPCVLVQFSVEFTEHGYVAWGQTGSCFMAALQKTGGFTEKRGSKTSTENTIW